MNAAQMRLSLVSRYPGSKRWIARVNRMTDAQIVAIYMRISKQERQNEYSASGHEGR